MSDLERRMIEDRAIRDAAKALVHADYAHLRADFAGKGIGERMLDNVGEGARDVFERAADAAETHRGVLAALIGAVFVWFARNPIMSLFVAEEGDDGRDKDAEHD